MNSNNFGRAPGGNGSNNNNNNNSSKMSGLGMALRKNGVNPGNSANNNNNNNNNKNKPRPPQPHNGPVQTYLHNPRTSDHKVLAKIRANGLKTPNDHGGATNMTGNYSSDKRKNNANNMMSNALNNNNNNNNNQLRYTSNNGVLIGKKAHIMDKKKDNMSSMGAMGTTYSKDAVYVGGPNVMSQGKRLQADSETMVHVISKNGFGMKDMDYHNQLGFGNDSVAVHGPIKPLRDANLGSKSPKSFYTPMTPKTKKGAARYLFGDDSVESQDKAETRIETDFNNNFGQVSVSLGPPYQFMSQDKALGNVYDKSLHPKQKESLQAYGRPNGASIMDILSNHSPQNPAPDAQQKASQLRTKNVATMKKIYNNNGQ